MKLQATFRSIISLFLPYKPYLGIIVFYFDIVLRSLHIHKPISTTNVKVKLQKIILKQNYTFFAPPESLKNPWETLICFFYIILLVICDVILVQCSQKDVRHRSLRTISGFAQSECLILTLLSPKKIPPPPLLIRKRNRSEHSPE